MCDWCPQNRATYLVSFWGTVGEAGTQDGVTTQAFHAEGDGQTVSVSIGPDPDDEAQRLVTVGGVVNG